MTHPPAGSAAPQEEMPTRPEFPHTVTVSGYLVLERAFDKLRARAERLQREREEADRERNEAQQLAAEWTIKLVAAENEREELLEALRDLRAESALASAYEECQKVCADKSLAYSEAGDIARANAAWVCKDAIRNLTRGGKA